MTIQNGRFQPATKAEILGNFLESAEESWGRELSEDEEATIVHFFDPIADQIAEQQGQMREVLDSTQLDHASGQALDYLASLVGVLRKEAGPSTVRLEFQSNDPVSNDYVIPSGSVAQTDNSDPVKFETDTSKTLAYIDGFEDGNIGNYVNDTGSFQTQTGVVFDGTYALEATASGTILDADRPTERGSKYHYKQQLTADAAGGWLFATQDSNNNYYVNIDAATNTISVELVDGGTETTIASQSATVPTGEWLDISVRWENGGDIQVIVDDASGNAVANISGTESEITFPEGGVGFKSETSNSIYFDHLRSSIISIDATATSNGADTNVGPDTVTVLGSSISGIDSVTNPASADGGRDREPDDDYRDRVREEISDGSSATIDALINAIKSVQTTRTVTIVDNDTSSTDADGRPAHSFEAIVDVSADYYEDVAQAIAETKAVGDQSVGGYDGTKVERTVTVVNGQEKTIAFSIPNAVTIYVTVDIVKDPDTYGGDDRVASSIVQYIGGVLSTGENVDGELSVGDDVIYNQILEAVMNVSGVHDINSLSIGTSSSPTGTSNITITDSENATIDALADHIEITTSDL